MLHSNSKEMVCVVKSYGHYFIGTIFDLFGVSIKIKLNQDNSNIHILYFYYLVLNYK